MKTLRILTIIFSLLIIIGAGHGIAPMGLLEIVAINEWISGDFQFSLSGTYDDRLLTAALFFVVAQALLISAFFFDGKAKSILTIVGSLILLIAIFILTENAISSGLDQFTFLFCLPSIATALILIYRDALEIALDTTPEEITEDKP